MRGPIELDKIRLVDFGRSKCRFDLDEMTSGVDPMGEERRKVIEDEEWARMVKEEMEEVEVMLRG